MSDLKNGLKFYISEEIAETDIADAATFESTFTWTEIEQVSEVPPFGFESEMVDLPFITSDFVGADVGSATGSSGELVVTKSVNAGGHSELYDIGKHDYRFKHAVKIELNNKLNPTGTNEIRYTRAIIKGPNLNGGSLNDRNFDSFTVRTVQPVMIADETAGS